MVNIIDREIDTDEYVIDDTADPKNPPRIGQVESIQIVRKTHDDDDDDGETYDEGDKEACIVVRWFDGTHEYTEPSLEDELVVIDKPSTRERLAFTGHKDGNRDTVSIRAE